jgi:hypothetical protein
MKNTITLLFALIFGVAVQAQDAQTRSSFTQKVNDYYTKYQKEGFITYKGCDLPMERNTEFPIWVDLKEGRWYQFCIVGDPEATKFEFKLGKEEVGSIITNKFKNEKVNEFYSQFSFICPRSGRYLITFFQRGPRKNLLGHVAILQRPSHTQDGQSITYSLK